MWFNKASWWEEAMHITKWWSLTWDISVFDKDVHVIGTSWRECGLISLFYYEIYQHECSMKDSSNGAKVLANDDIATSAYLLLSLLPCSSFRLSLYSSGRSVIIGTLHDRSQSLTKWAVRRLAELRWCIDRFWVWTAGLWQFWAFKVR